MRRVGLLLVAIGLAVTGCGTMQAADSTAGAPPAVDISGQWVGAWGGFDDVDGLARRDDATARLVQQGASGTGRLALHTTGVTQAMPETVIDAGLSGVRVDFDVSGNQVVMRHALGGRLVTADLTVEGTKTFGFYAVPRGKAKGIVVFDHGYSHTAYSWVQHVEQVAARDHVIAVAMDYRFRSPPRRRRLPRRRQPPRRSPSRPSRRRRPSPSPSPPRPRPRRPSRSGPPRRSSRASTR